MEPGSVESTAKSMQDSWIDVPEGKEGSAGEEGQEEEGNLTHSRSQQEMEQLLASAASDDEGSEDITSVPTFTIPEQAIESGIQQVSSVAAEGRRHASAASERLHSSSRLQGLSWLLGGGVANLLLPVLVLTHLALFGLGFYIGRRTTLVKTL